MLKTLRTYVRLKFSLMADAELNTVLPKAEALFDASVQRGKVLSLAEVRRSVGL